MPIDASLFMQFANQRAQEDANFQNALSQGINNYVTGRARREELDLKKQELARAGFDIDKMAYNAAYKASLGQPLTAEDLAAVEAKSVFEGQKTLFTPTDANGVSRAYSQPTLMDRFQAIPGAQQYQSSFPPLGQTQPAQGGMAATNLGQVPSMGAGELPPPPALTPQQDAALDARGNPFSQDAAPLPTAQPARKIVAPQLPFGATNTDVKAAQADIDLQVKEAELPLEVRLAREREDARKRAELAIKTETTKAENKVKNSEAIPLLEAMLGQNQKTLNIPYAGEVQGAARVLAPTASKNLDLMQQNRLNLAAPLAKALGVNPTDKDFKATLDRIVDVNATQDSRDAQIRQLMRQIINKDPEAAGLPAGAVEYKLYNNRMIYKLPDGTYVMEQ